MAEQTQFSDKVCWAATTIVGGAVGALSRNVLGVIVGAAVGFILGKAVICKNNGVKQFFKDATDFETGIRTALQDTVLKEKLSSMLVEQKFADNKNTALIMIGHSLAELHKDPKKYFALYGNSQSRPASAVHGMRIPNSISSSAAQTATRKYA